MKASRRFDEAKLDYTELQPRDYSRYYLLSNPFPAIPVAEEEPRVFVDRENEVKSVANITKEAFLTNKSQTLIIQGVYGNGKSHLLKYVKSRINSQLAKNPKKRGIAAYVQSPGSSIKDFYAEMVRDLGIDLMTDLACRIIVSTIGVSSLADYIYHENEKPRFKQYSDRIEGDPVVLNQMFSRGGYRVRDIRSDVMQKVGSKIPFPDVLSVVLSLTESEISGIAWRWLLGEFLPRDDKSSIGVTQEIEESDDVLRAFSSLKSLLGMHGLTMIYVLLDEFEKVSELHALRRSRYYDDLRHLIDQNTEGLCLIACVSPAGWDELRSAGHPLARRLMGNVEELTPFDARKSERLVEAYLELGREEFAVAKRIPSLTKLYEEVGAKYESPKLFPFTKKSLEAILKLSHGNVSEILRLCKRLIDEGCDRKIPVIDDIEMVNKLLGVSSDSSA